MPKVSEKPNSDRQVLKSADGNVVRCLYVTGIPVYAAQAELLSVLNRYGKVMTFFLKKQNRPFKKTTFAFVTYSEPEEAFRLFAARFRLMFKGKKLYVSAADAWHQPVVGPDGTIDFDPRSSARVRVPSVEEEDLEEAPEEPLHQVSQDCPVDRLNDDCLLQIVESVPFAQRHVLGQVCRRWRNLMSLYWSKVTILDFDVEPFDQVGFSDGRLELYLRLCPNVRSVRLVNGNVFSPGNVGLSTSRSVVKTAALCPKLEELTMSGMELTGRPLTAVAHRCKNLKSLSVRTCQFLESDNEMISVIKKCHQLETLRFTNCNLKPGMWLKILRPGIESLSLLLCDFNLKHLTTGLENLRDTLKEFNLMVDVDSEPLDFSRLHDFPNLEKVVYMNRSHHRQRTSSDMFRNLKTLELESNNFVTDELLRGLVQHSPSLSLLNLADSKDPRLTSDGFKALTDLKHLVELNLSKNNIDDDVLVEMADKCVNLQVLTISLCQGITDSGCKKIVRNLSKLRGLHLDGCRSVTDKTVESAVEAASRDPDKAYLTLYVAETNITDVRPKPHAKVELSRVNRRDLKSFLCSGLEDFLDDDLAEDDEDDEYNFDIYDEDDIFGYPYDSDDFDFDFDDLDGLNPLNIYLNIM